MNTFKCKPEGVIEIFEHTDGSATVKLAGESMAGVIVHLLAQVGFRDVVIKHAAPVQSKLLKRRLFLRLTQNAVCTHAGICRTYYDQLETGVKRASYETQLRVAAALGCRIEDVFDYVGRSCLRDKAGRMCAAAKARPVKRLRKARGMTIPQVAEVIGITYEMYEMIERTNKCDDCDICEELQRLFGVTLAELGLCSKLGIQV